jgi:hypothetical protein
MKKTLDNREIEKQVKSIHAGVDVLSLDRNDVET